MDWKKTKNILIGALILMNIILVYNIYYVGKTVEPVTYDLSAVENLMDERNIDISRLQYQEYSEMPVFSVGKSKYSLGMLGALEESGFAITEENDVLIIKKNIGMLSDDEIMRTIEEILEIAEIDADQYKIVYDGELEGINKVVINQVFDGYVFDDGYIQFEITQGEEIIGRYQWLDIEDLQKVFPGEIYPMEKSILSLIDIQEDSSTVLDIYSFEIIYHVSEQDELMIGSLEVSETRPYSKVITQEGEFYSFTGLR